MSLAAAVLSGSVVAGANVNVEPHMTKAQAELRDGMRHYRAGRYAEAAPHLDAAAAAGADAELCLGSLAYCHLRLGRPADAEAAAARLDRLVPNSGRAAFLLGLAAEAQADLPAARAHWRLAAVRGDDMAILKLGAGQ